MTARVCYLRQSDRGARLSRVRLIAERVGTLAEESWEPREATEATPLELSETAAVWIQDRLASFPGRPGYLDVLCVDPDGSVCSWLSTPSREAVVVGAVARQSGEPPPDLSGASSSRASTSVLSPLAFYAGTPIEADVQGLADPHDQNGHPASTRLAVLAASDAAARNLLDALDRRKVRIGAVLSLWHAMALAWDPSSPANSRPPVADRLVSDQGATASLLVTLDGRLLWCWARRGQLLAASTMRLPSRYVGPDRPASVSLGPEQASRLTAEWLAWSVQIGCVPSRVVCVAPESLSDDPDSGLARFGQALAAAWPGAGVDIVPHADPLQATLRRAALAFEVRSEGAEGAEPAATLDQPGAVLLGLTRRPGRLHRSMYVWASLAVAAAAAAIGIMALSLREDARRARSDAQSLERQAAELVEQRIPGASEKVDPPPDQLRALVRTQESKLKRPASAPGAMPVLEELEVLSLLLSSPDFEIVSIRLMDTIPTVEVVVPGTDSYEAIKESVDRIKGSFCKWRVDLKSGGGDRVTVTMTGTWTDEAKARARLGSAPEGGGAAP